MIKSKEALSLLPLLMTYFNSKLVFSSSFKAVILNDDTREKQVYSVMRYSISFPGIYEVSNLFFLEMPNKHLTQLYVLGF